MSKHIVQISASGSLEECIQSYLSAAQAITDSLPAKAHKSLCVSLIAHYTFLQAMQEAEQDYNSPRLEHMLEELGNILAEAGITLTNHKA